MRPITSYVPDGPNVTATTIAAMHRLVKDAVLDPRFRMLAGQIAQEAGVARRDYTGEAAALLAWVQNNVRYVRDPDLPGVGLESVADPRVTAATTRQGDCDDLSTLLAALAASIGFQYAFVTVGDDAGKPNEFRHVYVTIYVPGKGWFAADPSFEQPLGWEPDRKNVFPLADGTRVAPAAVRKEWPPA